MIDWIWRMLGRKRAPRVDPVYAAQLREHARVMALAAKAAPADPVIRAALDDATAERRRIDREMRAADAVPRRSTWT